jgi:hypothetical protein
MNCKELMYIDTDIINVYNLKEKNAVWHCFMFISVVIYFVFLIQITQELLTKL